MTNIILYEPNRQKLSELEFLKTSNSWLKLRDSDSYELTKALAHWLAETSFALGIKEPISDFNKKDVVELVLGKYRNFSMDELYYAFKMERYGNLKPESKDDPWIVPHFQLFNAEYVNKVLHKFKIWKRDKSMEHNIVLDKKAPKTTEAEKKYWIDRSVTSCLSHFEENRFVEEHKFYVYDILYDEGYLCKDVDFKKKVYAEARETLAFEYESKKPRSRGDKKNIDQILEDIKNPKSGKVKARAKVIVLNRFFRELTKDEQKTEDFKTKFT